ncbi:PRKR-interacting protein 1 [Cytospora mali]|uniref:PRKR-interacting protein 1 n=1 Tax=Cytospora mali TaxID=578113 RepID=A0A194VSM9_CYTMA|nr:PRKR-interacting protein 1 [Valsa mali]
MSGTGPESLPTSADPRSKRPVKKRALSPTSAQANQVSSLFARPDQEIRIPAGAPDAKRRLPAPPEIVTNVQGSSAGAGSGEFHVYKAARRREYERLRVMDEEVRQEKEAEEFARKREELERRDDDKTRRNREKREKMKARKGKAKHGGKGAGGQTGDKQGGGDGGVKPRVDKADVAAKDARDGEVKSDSVGTDSKGDLPVAAAAASTPGLVIHDDD